MAASVSPAEREMVLTEGATVTVNPLANKQAPYPGGGSLPFTGALMIRAGSGFTRFYTWDGETRSVDLWPRDKRWYGSFGAYYPGPGSHWRSNHGITRGTLQEGQMHFDTVEDAQKWLADMPCAVYTHEGLVVDFSKNSGGGGTLNVDVWQVFVRGKRPAMLKDSHDELISVSGWK
jgi:hypothetical protein